MDKKYFIELRSLEEFPAKIHFTIGNDFFEEDDKPDIEGGLINADITVRRLGEGFALDIDINGTLKVICDRCLGIVELPVENSLELRVEDSDGVESDDEDLVYMTSEETGVDVGWTIYEMALLALPIQKVHKDGECDKSMMKILDRYSKNGDNDKDESTDPRWDALKALRK